MTAPTDAERACPQCGPSVTCDEDGLCGSCGADTLSMTTGWYPAALAAVRAQERERCARIAETHIGSFGGNPDYCAQKIADAIRRREG